MNRFFLAIVFVNFGLMVRAQFGPPPNIHFNPPSPMPMMDPARMGFYGAYYYPSLSVKVDVAQLHENYGGLVVSAKNLAIMPVSVNIPFSEAPLSKMPKGISSTDIEKLQYRYSDSLRKGLQDVFAGIKPTTEERKKAARKGKRLDTLSVEVMRLDQVDSLWKTQNKEAPYYKDEVNFRDSKTKAVLTGKVLLFTQVKYTLTKVSKLRLESMFKSLDLVDVNGYEVDFTWVDGATGAEVCTLHISFTGSPGNTSVKAEKFIGRSVLSSMNKVPYSSASTANGW